MPAEGSINATQMLSMLRHPALPFPHLQVSFQALARSPKLAARARAELNARQHTGRIQKDDGSEVPPLSCFP